MELKLITNIAQLEIQQTLKQCCMYIIVSFLSIIYLQLHVHESNKTDVLTGYMKTIPCSPPVDGDYGVFAMDCEMVGQFDYRRTFSDALFALLIIEECLLIKYMFFASPLYRRTFSDNILGTVCCFILFYMNITIFLFTLQVYTHAGLELARVTVIGTDLKPIYETLVKPAQPIIDCNTR